MDDHTWSEPHSQARIRLLHTHDAAAHNEKRDRASRRKRRRHVCAVDARVLAHSSFCWSVRSLRVEGDQGRERDLQKESLTHSVSRDISTSRRHRARVSRFDLSLVSMYGDCTTRCETAPALPAATASSVSHSRSENGYGLPQSASGQRSCSRGSEI